ncbi:putative target of rapamycin (TOR) kinase 1 [Trypanosoma cruzi]|uniref:Putative target of rapamycin (TOR) kinase 1 n=1 Tax=Trypanosoma cruzi TaxID=5693 RepID=A0A2V2WEV2_TRYCR|nr:putative target of rapamycin (TOR) kinase 1 [Trypanosoma cruzi]
MRPPLFHQGSATTIIGTSPRDCAGDIPCEPSTGSGWFGREIATHHREYNRKRNNKPTEKASAAIITDASLHGWGAVFIPDSGDVKIAGGKWEKKPFLITQAEARAVRLALSAFSAILPSTVDVWADNTSLQGAANKGSSKSHALTRELQRICEFVESRGIQATFAYVRSAENPADGISRGRVFTLQDLAKGWNLRRAAAGSCGWRTPKSATS